MRASPSIPTSPLPARPPWRRRRKRTPSSNPGKRLGPLHGLPFALKDNIETEGIRTTGGSKILSSHIPRRDASVVRKLKAAGAVILGKTNMPEFALGATTNNPHYGPTRNPYDLSRTPGGSSGGSAAATAAGLAAAALGTDTGGSVRVPSGLCGVVGLRPTHGRVGRGGVIPLSFSRDSVGPITRTVRDSAMVLEVIAGRDRADPQSASRPVPPYSDLTPDGLRGRRFGLPKRFIADMIHQDTEEVMNDAVRIIRAMGGVVREIEIPSLGLAHAADFNVVMPEAVCLLEEYLLAVDPFSLHRRMPRPDGGRRKRDSGARGRRPGIETGPRVPLSQHPPQ